MGTRLLFLVNPRGSRAGEGTTRARTVLEAAGVELVAPPFPARTEALRELIRARAPAVDGVVLGGGDGTLHAALPALLACERPLGVLPLGTANDFARSIGVPLDPAEAAAAIAAGVRRSVDVGFVDDRPYLNTASVGLAATLRGDLTRADKQRLGALAYPLAALRRWRQSLPFSARVRAADGTLHLLRTRQLSVANGPSQGGGTVDPENAADDGLLALHAVEARDLGALLLAHLALRLRRPSVAPGLLALRGRWFEVHTDRPLEVSADGEHVGRTPARFTIRPAALEVFVLRAAQPVSTAGSESSGWLHDEAVVALNGLVAALAETARAGEEAAARLAEDEPLATLLAALAQRRRAHAELLAVDVRQLGALPRAEDPDRSALASLWSRARALVADDPGASELAARAGAERALATRAREALAAALPEPVARRISAIARECEASADGLERLGRSSRRTPP